MQKTINSKRKASAAPSSAKHSSAIGKARPVPAQQKDATTEKLIARIEHLSVQLAESRKEAKLSSIRIEELAAEINWRKERGVLGLNYSQKLHRLGTILAALFVDEMAEPPLVAAFQRAIAEVKEQLIQKDHVNLSALEAYHYFPRVALALTPQDKVANATRPVPFKRSEDEDAA